MSAGRLMTKRRYPPAAREQILAALEAGSAALRAVEVAAALGMEGDDSHRGRGEHLDRAIELLRQSIRELRLAEGGEEPGVGATAFVLAVERRRRGRKPPTDPPSAE